MSLQSIKYSPGKLEILDQLLLPVISKYIAVKGVEDGWKVINKMQVRFFLENLSIKLQKPRKCSLIKMFMDQNDISSYLHLFLLSVFLKISI